MSRCLKPGPELPALLFRPVAGPGTLDMLVYHRARFIGEVHRRGAYLEYQRCDDWWPVFQSKSFGTLASMVAMMHANDLRRECCDVEASDPGHAAILASLHFVRLAIH